MAMQIMILGLGSFGMALARALSGKGVEVVAADIRREAVEEAAVFVSEAVCLDVTDEAELAKLKPASRDVVVCAIGSESKEASIICTALLRQMGVKMLVARAHDRLHARILKLVGAHAVVNPEEEFGRRMANQLFFSRSISSQDSPDGGLQLMELPLPESMAGKTLRQLELPRRYGIILAGIERGTPKSVVRPAPDFPLEKGDVMVLLCTEQELMRFAKENSR